MLSLHSLSAWIEVDGKELEQYGVEDLGRNQVTCWIATQADKSFSVVFRDDAASREHALGSSLSLDGTPIAGRVLCQPLSITAAKNRTVVQNGQVASVTSSRPFVFSKLELTDEDEYLNQSSTHLGEIRISIHRVQPLESGLPAGGPSASSHGKVHERSKKAVTHCVSYGKEVKTEAQYSCRVRFLDGDVPLATFIFRYRDSGLLQANGIIPKPPPAKRVATVSKDVFDLTTEDYSDVKVEPGIEIVDNVFQMKKSSPSKRSNSGSVSEAQPAKKIKREVIDLT